MSLRERARAASHPWNPTAGHLNHSWAVWILRTIIITQQCITIWQAEDNSTEAHFSPWRAINGWFHRMQAPLLCFLSCPGEEAAGSAWWSTARVKGWPDKTCVHMLPFWTAVTTAWNPNHIHWTRSIAQMHFCQYQLHAERHIAQVLCLGEWLSAISFLTAERWSERVLVNGANLCHPSVKTLFNSVNMQCMATPMLPHLKQFECVFWVVLFWSFLLVLIPFCGFLSCQLWCSNIERLRFTNASEMRCDVTFIHTHFLPHGGLRFSLEKLSLHLLPAVADRLSNRYSVNGLPSSLDS